MFPTVSVGGHDAALQEKVPKSLEASAVGSGCLATHALFPG